MLQAGPATVVGVGIGNAPPSWTSLPNPLFSQGSSSTYDLNQNINDDARAALTWSVVSGVLPTGVTLDPASGILSYDGVGAADAQAVRINVGDSAGSANSGTFDVIIADLSLPSEWNNFMALMDTEMPAHIDNFATGPSPIPSNPGNAYGELNSSSHSIFHSASKIIQLYEEFRTRRGEAITHGIPGRRAALQIYLRLWNQPNTTRRQTQSDSLYYALNGYNGYGAGFQYHDSDTMLSGPLTLVNNQDLLDSIENPVYGTLSQLDAGPPWWNYGQFQGSGQFWFGNGYGTHLNRPAALVSLAHLNWLRNNDATGTGASVPYIDPTLGEDPLRYDIHMCVSHVHRFRNEQYATFIEPQTSGKRDSGFFDLMHYTWNFLREFYEHSIANGLDPDRYMPNVGAQAIPYVMDGDYFINGDENNDVSAIVSPYTVEMGPTPYAILNMLINTMEWIYNPLDLQWTIAGTPGNAVIGPHGNSYEYPHLANDIDHFNEAPQQSRTDPAMSQPAPYFRVLVQNTTRRNPPGQDGFVVTKYRGDPMVFYYDAPDRVHHLGRTGGDGGSGNNSNIQMMMCTDLWFCAKVMQDYSVDPVRIAKFMNWAELVFNGNLDSGALGGSKAINQRYWHFFEGCEYLDVLTGGQVYTP